MARFAALPAGPVIDIGAGDGQFAAALRAARPDWPVVAIEPSAAFSPAAPCARARAEALPLADNSAAAAVFLSVLRHAADRVRALREARRVVRPGGRLVVVELDPDASPARVRRHVGSMQSALARLTFVTVALAACPPVTTWVELATEAGWRRVTAVADELQPVAVVTAS